MFRSETVLYYKLILPAANCWEVMNSLGELGCVHMKDLMKTTIIPERPFYHNLKHCDDTMDRVKKIIQTLKDRRADITPCEDYNIFLRNLKEIIKRQGLKERNYFEHISEEIKKLDKNLHE